MTVEQARTLAEAYLYIDLMLAAEGIAVDLRDYRPRTTLSEGEDAWTGSTLVWRLAVGAAGPPPKRG